MENEARMETRVSLIEMQLKTIERDAEKREKIQDARHAETMATLKQLGAEVSSGRDFGRGVRATGAVIWAVVGSVPASVITWLITKGPA